MANPAEVLADLARRGRRARRVVAGLDDAGWRRPRRPRAGTSPPRSRTWPGPTRPPLRAATDKAGFGRAGAARRCADPHGFVDDAAAEGARGAAGRAAGRAGATAGRALAEALRALPDGTRMPLVRAADERRPRWPPPGSWRPGRTASTSPTRSASAREPTDRLRHVAHLGVRTRDFAFARARAGRRRPRSSASS